MTDERIKEMLRKVLDLTNNEVYFNFDKQVEIIKQYVNGPEPFGILEIHDCDVIHHPSFQESNKE